MCHDSTKSCWMGYETCPYGSHLMSSTCHPAKKLPKLSLGCFLFNHAKTLIVEVSHHDSSGTQSMCLLSFVGARRNHHCVSRSGGSVGELLPSPDRSPGGSLLVTWFRLAIYIFFSKGYHPSKNQSLNKDVLKYQRTVPDTPNDVLIRSFFKYRCSRGSSFIPPLLARIRISWFCHFF